MKKNRNKGWRKDISKKKQISKRSDHKNKLVEKNWKLLYIRSEKLKRAKQLGIEYPIKSQMDSYLQEELSWQDMFKTVSKILRYEWNPIGFSELLPDDEYDSYALQIIKLIQAKKTQEVIAEELKKIAIKFMGIEMPLEKCLYVATLLLEIKEQ